MSTIHTKTRRQKKKHRFSFMLLWFLFSIITGFSIAAVHLTNGTTDSFYNVGDTMQLITDDTVFYSPNPQFITVIEDATELPLYCNAPNTPWKYISISISNLTVDSVNLYIYYYNKDNEFLGTDSFALPNGSYVLPVSADAFSFLHIDAASPTGATFYINQLQLSTLPPADYPILSYGILYTIFCLLFTFLFYFIGKKFNLHFHWYMAVQALQQLFIAISSIFFYRLSSLGSRKRSYVKIFIISIMFVVLSFTNVYSFYFDASVNKYLMLFFVCCLLLLAGFSIDGKLTLQDWNNPLVLSWFSLWVMTCISDFLVAKQRPVFSFYGYLMLFIVGYLFFIWSNLKNPAIILWEICKAVEWTFFGCTLYCLLCRPEYPGISYTGFYNNPNPFGLYLAVVSCIFLCELEHYIKQPNRRLPQLALYSCGFCAAACFLWKSQCTTAVFAFCGITAIWVFRYLRHFFSFPYKKRILTVLLALMVCFIPVTAGIHWGIHNLPYLFQTKIVYPKDMYIAEKPVSLFPKGSVTYAAEPSTEFVAGSIAEKFSNATSIDSLLSGRMNYYKSYLQTMNLWGHSRWPRINGRNADYAHNGFFAYSHTYGVYTLLPYFFMFLYFFRYSIAYMRRSKFSNSFSFLPFSVIFVFFLENMMDNVDTPFHWITWFIYMFMGGLLFKQPSHET